MVGSNTKHWRVIAAMVQLPLTVGCGNASRTDPATTIAFVLPNGGSVNAVNYVVLSPAGAELAAGTEAVANQNANLSLELFLPAGSGEVLRLTATTSEGDSCSGASPPFDVLAGTPASVSVALTCVFVGADPDDCPSVNVQPPTPAQARAPSGTITVAATASDPDLGDVVSFSWAASAGSFSDPKAASTSYLCATPGSETLVLTVDDHHVPSACSETFLLPVTCLPSPDAVCGDGIVEGGESCDPPDGVTCGADCQLLPRG
jgi:hypothetical protein